MKKTRLAFGLNLVLVLLEVFAVLWMMSGNSAGNLSAPSFRALKYFTVDSNILMGIVALIMALDQRRVLKGEREEIPQGSYTLKLMGTVSVTLTMLVTLFYLTPMYAAEYGLFSNYVNSNFFLHLANPLLSIVIFVFFEKTNQLTLKDVALGILPMVLYTIYYVAIALLNLQDGQIAPGYDWYGFFFAGASSALIVVPLITLITFGISLGLWWLNRKRG